MQIKNIKVWRFHSLLNIVFLSSQERALINNWTSIRHFKRFLSTSSTGTFPHVYPRLLINFINSSFWCLASSERSFSRYSYRRFSSRKWPSVQYLENISANLSSILPPMSETAAWASRMTWFIKKNRSSKDWSSKLVAQSHEYLVPVRLILYPSSRSSSRDITWIDGRIRLQKDLHSNVHIDTGRLSCMLNM